MKAFFEQCLRDLHRLTGLKQYLEICNKPTEAEAKEEMDIIVAGMVRVSEKFNYIPQEAQKSIVAHQIISDPEMYALNAKIVYKWFNAVSDKYWHESGHLETNDQRNEVNVKEISPEEQKRIDEIAAKFLSDLATGAIKEVPQVSLRDLQKIQIEDDVRQKGALSKGVPFTSEQELKRRRLHLQWISENIHPITKEKLPGFIDEQTWLNNLTQPKLNQNENAKGMESI